MRRIAAFILLANCANVLTTSLLIQLRSHSRTLCKWHSDCMGVTLQIRHSYIEEFPTFYAAYIGEQILNITLSLFFATTLTQTRCACQLILGVSFAMVSKNHLGLNEEL